MTITLEQVAEREVKYLVELFNKIGKQNGGKAFNAKDVPLGEPFVYNHLGSMASVGRYKALVDLRQSKVIVSLWYRFVLCFLFMFQKMQKTCFCFFESFENVIIYIKLPKSYEVDIHASHRKLVCRTVAENGSQNIF